MMLPTTEMSMRDFVRILNRWRPLIILIVLLGTGIAVAIGLSQTPLYTAETTLLLDTRKTQVIDIQAVMSGLPPDFAAIRSELDILSSSELAKRVVERGGLLTDPEFAPSTMKGSPNASVLSRWLPEYLSVRLGLEQPSDDTDSDPQTKLDQVIEIYHRHLHILNDNRSYTIRVQFDSISPDKAARIANLTAQIYIDGQLQAKFDANQRANAWLNERIVDLREQVRKSDNDVQEYRARNQLIESRGATVSDQQLGELNTQLILARTERAQAEARLKRIRDLEDSSEGLNAAREVLSSSLIQRLREQESDLQRRESELSAVYDEKHPKMVNIRAEIRDFKRTIKEEIDKVALSVANDVAVARSRETALANSLADIEHRTAEASHADVELKELQRDADANRTLFQTFLNRSKETSSQDDLQHADARIISAAALPKSSSSISLVTITGIAFLASLLAGLSLALLLERLDNRYLTPIQLHQTTRHPVLGMLPNIANSASADVHDHPLKHPHSAFTESLRTIRLATKYSNTDNPPKIILVTSSIVSEGKTTFSAAFAQLAAKSGGRVLVVDCDHRRPRLKDLMGVTPVANLQDVLTGVADTSALPLCDPSGGMDFISAIPGTVETQDLFGSSRMADFLRQMSQRYDLIILDTPPVMAISVASNLAGLADICLYLVRWNKTPRDLVASGLKQLESSNCKSIGLILSRVDLRRHRRLGYGDQAFYYGEYGDYYTT